MARGFRNRPFAQLINCTENTVEKHINGIVSRLALDRSLDIRVQIANIVNAEAPVARPNDRGASTILDARSLEGKH